MKKLNKRNITSIIIGLSLIILVAVFVTVFLPKIIYYNNLKTVLNYALTLPEEYTDMTYGKAIVSPPKEIKVDDEQDIKELFDKNNKGLNENISSCFDEKGYSIFKQCWYCYSLFCAGTDYYTKVKSISFEEDKNNKQTLFTVIMTLYKPNSETEDLTIKGKARNNGRGKIEYFTFTGKSFALFTEYRLNMEYNN